MTETIKPFSRDEIKQQLLARQEELRSCVEEYNEIEETLAAFEGRRVAGRRSSAPRAAKGQRKNEVLEIVTRSKDGFTPSQIANEIQVAPSQVYNLVKALEEEGQVTKKDGKYYPSEASRKKMPQSPVAVKS
jgi:predicted Rossmann fold nucleotide-binding protein DprA/Smf involved in DNA uptake